MDLQELRQVVLQAQVLEQQQVRLEQQQVQLQERQVQQEKYC
jgi:hypothetical protein